jgi:ADP-ribose pyrophosphatase YjhB (NUDIX family)
MGKDTKPDIQLTANVVIVNSKREVLLTRYDPDDERWWIPGASLETYEHPDTASKRAVVDVGQSETLTTTMKHVESFRGRRGWHVMFNYVAQTRSSEIDGESKWFPLEELPSTVHGEWEKNVIARCVAGL